MSECQEQREQGHSARLHGTEWEGSHKGNILFKIRTISFSPKVARELQIQGHAHNTLSQGSPDGSPSCLCSRKQGTQWSSSPKWIRRGVETGLELLETHRKTNWKFPKRRETQRHLCPSQPPTHTGCEASQGSHKEQSLPGQWVLRKQPWSGARPSWDQVPALLLTILTSSKTLGLSERVSGFLPVKWSCKTGPTSVIGLYKDQVREKSKTLETIVYIYSKQ